jgi:DNA polymerase-3 subunit delta'
MQGRGLIDDGPIVTGFDAILGQDRPLRILLALVANAAVPHALLFTGIDGIGRATAARALAMALNCARQPGAGCDRCRDCRRIQAGSHPDVWKMAPAGTFFKISQVRELLATLAMKPYEARHRLVILEDAHAMTPAAGNALLKVLEEPPPRTVLVLTAPQASDLLPTIVSRCHHLRFQPLSDARIAALLVERCQLERADAVVLAALAGGSPAKALAQHEAAARWRQRRDWIAAQLDGIQTKSTAEILAMAEFLARDGKEVHESLELAKSWLRDRIVVRYRPSLAIHQDRIDVLQAGAAEKAAELLRVRQIAHLQRAQAALRANAPVRLTLEFLLFSLAREAGPAARGGGGP